MVDLALSNATFARGVDTIRNTMEANLQDRLQYERDRSLKTFSDVHGDALAQVMFRLCGCIDDSGLPPGAWIAPQDSKGACLRHVDGNVR